MLWIQLVRSGRRFGSNDFPGWHYLDSQNASAIDKLEKRGILMRYVRGSSNIRNESGNDFH